MFPPGVATTETRGCMYCAADWAARMRVAIGKPASRQTEQRKSSGLASAGMAISLAPDVSFRG
jgi:hypothetical protein